MTKVLVTGGAGYLGSVLVPALLERGCSVAVLDNFMYGQDSLAAACYHPQFSIVRGDVRSMDTMKPLLKDADVIIPLAALVGAPLCDRDPLAATSTNKQAIVDMLELIGRGQRVILPITNSGYGVGEAGKFCTEETPIRPVSLYGRDKVDVERTLLERHPSAISLRLATVFGMSPRMRLDLLVNTLTAHAYFRGKIRVSGRAHARPHLHAQDAATALLLAAEARDTLVRGQRFNVGDDSSNHGVRDIAGLVAAALPGTEVTVEPQLADARSYRVSFSKIRKTLGFARRFSVSDGVAEILAACRRGAIVGLEDPRHSNFDSLKRFGVPTLLSPAA